jgi:predicted nucleotidyltransferase
LNSIRPPWENTKARLSENEGLPRKTVEKTISKLIDLKVIKSRKQVFGSYLRGNQMIGDLDLLIPEKDKERVLGILKR